MRITDEARILWGIDPWVRTRDAETVEKQPKGARSRQAMSSSCCPRRPTSSSSSRSPRTQSATRASPWTARCLEAGAGGPTAPIVRSIGIGQRRGQGQAAGNVDFSVVHRSPSPIAGKASFVVNSGLREGTPDRSASNHRPPSPRATLVSHTANVSAGKNRE